MSGKDKGIVNNGYQPESQSQKGYQPFNEGYQPVDTSNPSPAQGGYQPSVASGDTPTPPGDE